MSVFTNSELRYLHDGQRLGRLATVGQDGTPHVVPTGWSYNAEQDVIDIGGIDLSQTKKYRDVLRTGRAAIVIDDVRPPWQPRGVEIRGRADVLAGPEQLIRLYPERIVSWGIESNEVGKRHSRTVGG
jgi:pyridoxamine 5'-phosphate oxidase family protein